MASTNPQHRANATPVMPTPAMQDAVFDWRGRDRQGKQVCGQLSASNATLAQATLRQQGIFVTRLTKHRRQVGRAIRSRDIALLTRQMASMMKAGVPLLQSFDIVGRSTPNPRVVRLLAQLRQDVEIGTSLSAAFRKHPMYFDALYCNLVSAGESAGMLDTLMERLAIYQEKTQALKAQIASALIYPVVVVGVTLVVLGIIMVFVIPAFEQMFAAFHAELPPLTRAVLQLSAYGVAYWPWLAAGLVGTVYVCQQTWRRSVKIQQSVDRALLWIPIVGVLLKQSCMARWSRTLSTMFAAGVPLVEALECVGAASGNSVFHAATAHVQGAVATGSSLSVAMEATQVFSPLLVQMCAVGEESGAVDQMLGKAADFYEAQIDETVARLSSLLEPFIIVLLSCVIGGVVIAMYLPVFQLGQVI